MEPLWNVLDPEIAAYILIETQGHPKVTMRKAQGREVAFGWANIFVESI